MRQHLPRTAGTRHSEPSLLSDHRCLQLLPDDGAMTSPLWRSPQPGLDCPAWYSGREENRSPTPGFSSNGAERTPARKPSPLASTPSPRLPLLVDERQARQMRQPAPVRKRRPSACTWPDRYGHEFSSRQRPKRSMGCCLPMHPLANRPVRRRPRARRSFHGDGALKHPAGGRSPLVR